MIIRLFLLLAIVVPTLSFANDGALDAAYQQEFAYLSAEKKALEARLGQLNSEAATRRDSANAEISELRENLSRLTLEADSTEDALIDADHAAAQIEQRVDLLASALVQALASAGQGDADIPETPEDQAKEFGKAFESALVRIENGGKVYQETSEYFLADGTLVESPIVHIGNIASFGLNKAGAGALVPVGEGKFRLWKDGASTGSSLAAGTLPTNAGLFLFESAQKRVEESPEKTWGSTIEAGGAVGLVIVFLGFIGISLVFVRAAMLSWLSRGTRLVNQQLDTWISRPDTELDLNRVPEQSVTGSVVKALVDERKKSGKRSELEDRAAESLLKSTGSVERFGTAILVIAAVAPLLGLLGTVTGMIATFEIITEFGTGDPRLLSDGISEALVTTQLGLIVAIPTLLFGNLLSSWADGLLGRAEYAARRFINHADMNSTVTPFPFSKANHG